MIRPYKIEDDQALITLLRLNTPQYFAESEEKDFVKYLEKEAEHYFVVEENQQVVGAGGYNFFEEEGLARISWDIVHPDFQGRGIGKQLTLHRINQIKKNPGIKLIVVRTSQLAYPFYQKIGFEVEKTEKDYWAKGLDLYYMTMRSGNSL